MSLIIILFSYFLDYKSQKTTFLKDLTGGIFICIALLVSAIAITTFLNLNIVYGIFYMGVEIIIVFALKAFIQNKTN